MDRQFENKKMKTADAAKTLGMTVRADFSAVHRAMEAEGYETYDERLKTGGKPHKMVYLHDLADFSRKARAKALLNSVANVSGYCSQIEGSAFTKEKFKATFDALLSNPVTALIHNEYNWILSNTVQFDKVASVDYSHQSDVYDLTVVEEHIFILLFCYVFSCLSNRRKTHIIHKYAFTNFS